MASDELSLRAQDVLVALRFAQDATGGPASAAQVRDHYDPSANSVGVGQTLRRLRDRGFVVSTDDGYKLTRLGSGRVRSIRSAATAA